MKYPPPQVHVFKAWSPAGVTTVGGGENFRRWGLVGRLVHWEHASKGILSLTLSVLLSVSWTL
jgi:hypothetical protein